MLKDSDVFLVHALEKWRLRIMWKNMTEERYFFTSTPILFRS